jgi:hypothetical protein
MARNNLDFVDQLQDRDDRIRRLEIDGEKWTIVASDPYGFWKIKRSSGLLPEVLQGNYTGQGLAEAAIKHYVNVKKMKSEAAADRIEAAIYKSTDKKAKKAREAAESI